MKKIYIDSLGSRLRTAVTEETALLEIIHEDKSKKIVVGNMYTGIIQNILPSNFAFVDIGDEKNAFLYLSDRKEDKLYEYNDAKRKRELSIKQGQSITVQVLKEANGEKGATVTTQLSFSGRSAVLMYNATDVGVSKKVEDEEERKRLKQIARDILPEGYGIILRTNCAGKPEAHIREEIDRLLCVSKTVLQGGQFVKAPARIYEGLPETMKIVRDLFTEGLDKIIVNDEKIYTMLLEYIEKTENLELYTGDIPLFDNFLIEKQIEKALNQKVWLKSGGFIIIEETEACVVIDVNTGKFTDKNHEHVVVKTNEEAAKEVAKQIRLRNLSGMIIVDFIDMEKEEHKKSVMDVFKNELKKDRSSTSVVGMTKLGLMQLTRKKIGEPLSAILTKECTCCGGTGQVLNEEYLAFKIRNEISTIFAQTIYNTVVLKSNERVIRSFQGAHSDYQHLEARYGKRIEFQTIETYRYDYYELEKSKR